MLTTCYITAPLLLAYWCRTNLWCKCTGPLPFLWRGWHLESWVLCRYSPGITNVIQVSWRMLLIIMSVTCTYTFNYVDAAVSMWFLRGGRGGGETDFFLFSGGVAGPGLDRLTTAAILAAGGFWGGTGFIGFLIFRPIWFKNWQIE